MARFFARARAQKFYLTGGSALAEFYLGHRFSQDMDLFTQDKQAWQAIEEDVRFAVESVGGTLDFRAAKPQDELHRAIIRVAHEPELKVDIVRDAPPHFGEPEVQNDAVIVDSLENIAVGKLLALYGRAYPRDFVDVFFLLENGWNFRRLIELGKEKDPGLIEFYLAGTPGSGPGHPPAGAQPGRLPAD
ncbi:MAG: nucleotidyl transferase AbiEii/AbiGii toxin family protein [Chloroflexi bacterium]|nr:nucleotidyl transferase AbiEii/AbiGii toxin family protein [Chloroflexota bacterium]